MSDHVKAATVIAGAIIVAVLLWIYFSPFQSCLRERIAGGDERPAWRCAATIGNH